MMNTKMHLFSDTAKIAIGAWKGVQQHGVRRLAAGLAYYLLFALATLVLLVVMVGGVFVGTSRSATIIINLIDDLLGSQVGIFVREIINQGINEHVGVIATLVAIGFVIWGGSRLVLHLEEAFQIMFNHSTVEDENAVKGVVKKRIRSISYLILIAFVILVIFLFNILLPFILELIRDIFPIISKGMLFYIQAGAVFVIMLIAFALIYKIMAPINLPWKAVFIGSAVASLLFIIINTLFALYVAFISDKSFYGALGSVFALLIWTYWTSQGLLYGAEVARSYAERKYAHVSLKDVLG